MDEPPPSRSLSAPYRGLLGDPQGSGFPPQATPWGQNTLPREVKAAAPPRIATSPPPPDEETPPPAPRATKPPDQPSSVQPPSPSQPLPAFQPPAPSLPPSQGPPVVHSAPPSQTPAVQSGPADTPSGEAELPLNRRAPFSLDRNTDRSGTVADPPRCPGCACGCATGGECVCASPGREAVSRPDPPATDPRRIVRDGPLDRPVKYENGYWYMEDVSGHVWYGASAEKLLAHVGATNRSLYATTQVTREVPVTVGAPPATFSYAAPSSVVSYTAPPSTFSYTVPPTTFSYAAPSTVPTRSTFLGPVFSSPGSGAAYSSRFFGGSMGGLFRGAGGICVGGVCR
jgi:hypothetical protein